MLNAEKRVWFPFRIIKGEGAVSMVIKPLNAALVDHDHIYAVVWSSLDQPHNSLTTFFRYLERLLILVDPELLYMHHVQLHNNNAFEMLLLMQIEIPRQLIL
jgi:hypothetical protein